MNTNMIALHITGTIAALRSIQGSIANLPERQRRKVAGGANLDTIIANLEQARAEVLGEAQPVRDYPTLDLEPELLAIIDR